MSASGGSGRGAIKSGSGLTPQFAGKSVPIRPVLAGAYTRSKSFRVDSVAAVLMSPVPPSSPLSLFPAERMRLT